ncbi:MAG TPA: hypothetical protein VK452_05415 [Dissulfurispiraceae bacterium]|nr:hypothetical protein [Dissulfurispiraceae bacterium]
MSEQREAIYSWFKMITAGLLAAFFCGLFTQTTHGALPAAPAGRSEGAATQKTRIVIKNIVIDEPRIMVNIRGSKKSEKSILDQLPQVANGNLKNGMFEIVMSKSQRKIVVKNADLVIHEFNPESGGKASISGTFSYTQDDMKSALELDASASAVMTRKDPLTISASISTPSLDLAKIDESVKPYLPAEYRDWPAQGKAAAQTDIDCTYSGAALAVKAKHHVEVKSAGLSSKDGTKAAQGVQASADIIVNYVTAEDTLDFNLKSTLSGGEFLWGSYYKDLSGKTTHADVSGNVRLSGERPFKFAAASDIFGAGDIRIAGSGQRGWQTFSFDAGTTSLQKANELFVSDYLKQNVASLAGLGIDGSASVGVKIHRKDAQSDMNGKMAVDIKSLTIPAQKISISGMRLDLPFDLGYPKAFSGTAAKGLLEIKAAEKDRIRTRDVRIPILLTGNRLTLPEDAHLLVARGDVQITKFSADNILSPDRRISCGLKIDHLNLRPIQRSFTISPITGTLDVYYPKVNYYHDGLSAEGRTTISMFGGEITSGNITIERLLAASRRIAVDIAFRNINLEKATEKIAIGKMTGVIQGSLKDFEWDYGQPSRFVLDVDSVDTKGISQRISVEAIQSISVLGTGSSMGGVLNRGILSFFKDYPYSAIGIHATLKNDAFTVHGKIRSGGKEYLVRKGLLRGVDVVNQNPDNKISFKDMQERLTRIVESRKSGSAPVIK